MKWLMNLLNKEITIKVDALNLLLLGCFIFNVAAVALFYAMGSTLGMVLMSVYAIGCLWMLLRR